MGKKDKVEVLLWSIAFLGFGQILNKKFIKGTLSGRKEACKKGELYIYFFNYNNAK